MPDSQIIDTVFHLMHALILSSARMIGLFSILPLFSRQILPGLMRSVFIITLAFSVVPLVYDHVHNLAPGEGGVWRTLLLSSKELLIGILMGYIGALIFWAVEGAGFLIDNQRGASMASSMDPLSGNRTSPLGMLLFQGFLTYFVSIGGISLILSGLYWSYSIWPVFSFTPTILLPDGVFFIERLDWLMRVAFILCSPIMIAMFLTELAIGLVGRFTPQLNVFFISMPLKSAVAMGLLAVYTNLIFHYSDSDILALGRIDRILAPIIAP